MKVAVSYLSSNDYKKCIDQIENSKADFIHVDMCDGNYVETNNIDMNQILNLLSNTQKKLNIHLMVSNPLDYIDKLKNLNVDVITIHNIDNAINVLKYIKSLGIKCGIAINPNEDLKDFEKYFSIVDEVLVMSVMPGKGGQKFIESVLKTIDSLNLVKDNYHFDIAIDGGINSDTISLIKNKNLDLLISGSYITNSDNYNENIDKLIS